MTEEDTFRTLGDVTASVVFEASHESVIVSLHDKFGRFVGTKPRPRRSAVCECGNHAFASLSKWGVTIVSPEDIHFLQENAWWLSGDGTLVYAVRTVNSKGNYTRVWLHRAIINASEGYDVDHKSGNTLDNRRDNLREVSRTVNNHNRHTAPTGASGFRGVTLHKASGLWRAYYTINAKQYSAGYFKTAEEAAVAAEDARINLYGSLAASPHGPRRNVRKKA